MSWFLQPDSDVAVGTWYDTPLWSKINGGAPDDNTTIRTPNNSISAFEVTLSSPPAAPGAMQLSQEGGLSVCTNSLPNRAC